jgi:hypothetical protein
MSSMTNRISSYMDPPEFPGNFRRVILRSRAPVAIVGVFYKSGNVLR